MINQNSIIDESTKALQKYSLSDAPAGAFDRVTKLAAGFLQVPVALVTILEEDKILFLSHHGIYDATKLPINHDLCSIVTASQELFLIEDATLDQRLRKQPLVGEFGFRFFAAVPLTVKGGHNIGTLCVLDKKPRKFSEADIEILRDLASIVVDEFDLRMSMKRIIDLEKEVAFNAILERDKARHIAHHDFLTGLPNRLMFTQELEKELKEPMEDNKVPAIFMLDLDKFKSVNDTFGHQAGDLLLKEVAKRIKTCISGLDIAARLGGDEFVIMQRDSTRAEAEMLAELLVDKLSLPYEIEGHTISYVSASIGLTLYHPRDNVRQLIRNADLALYCAKSNGRNNYQVYNTSIDNSIQTRHRA